MLDVLGRDDRYYWVSAALTARGLHTRIHRGIGALIAILAATQVLLSFGGAEAIGIPGTPVVGALVAVAGAVMSLCWLRGWPSRRASQLCVVVGSACIALAAVTAPSPTVGVMALLAFGLVNGHAAMFHSRWLLAGTCGVCLAALWHATARLLPSDAAVAIVAVGAVVLINAVAVSVCRLVRRLIDTRSGHGQTDWLTGLLTREGFLEQVATLVGARSRGDDRHLVVVVVNVDNWSLVTAVRGQSAADRVRVAVAQCLSENARRDAVLARPHDCEFYVADLFTTADATPLIERLRSAVTTAPFRLSASIGVASTPLRPLAALPHYDVIDEMLAVATTAMYDARRSGGNAIRQVVGPPLAVLDPDRSGEGGHDAA